MNSFLKYLFIFPIRVYQILISPLLGPTCRFEPSCSKYMIKAIEEWGVVKGVFMGIKRIGRCHPWSQGGYDPVPCKNPKCSSKEEHHNSET